MDKEERVNLLTRVGQALGLGDRDSLHPLPGLLRFKEDLLVQAEYGGL